MTLLKFNDQLFSRRRFIRQGLSALPFVIFPGALSATLVMEQFIHRTVFAMGTTVSIQAFGSDRTLLQHALTKAFNALYRYDDLFSLYKYNSPINQINRCAGVKSVSVEGDVIDLVRHAVSYHEITEGSFNCTVEPLMQLWGFRQSLRDRIPSDREIDHALSLVGVEQIILNEDQQSVGLNRRGASIDLGGIAVGYTVDAMATILRQEGVTSALINHSGDLYALGSPPESAGWDVGIRLPKEKGEIVKVLSLKDEALSTSGSYEKFVILGEQQFGHIVDGFSGEPACHNLSISVVANTSITADALSTALFCHSDPYKMIDKFGTKLELYVVDKQLKQLHTKTLK
jgi:thiamine biosynthesis lipoprotein